MYSFVCQSESKPLDFKKKSSVWYTFTTTGWMVLILTHLCPRLEFLEFLHEIHVCYLKKFKEQEFEEKKNLLYFIVELCGVPKMEH